MARVGSLVLGLWVLGSRREMGYPTRCATVGNTLCGVPLDKLDDALRNSRNATEGVPYSSCYAEA